MPEETAMAVFAAALLIGGGWCVFSLCAGYIVYRSSMTRKGAVSGLRKNPDINAHGKDPRIMDRINEAKARWARSLAEGLIQRLSVVTGDGLRLQGYYLAADSTPQKEQKKRTVILVHGLRDSASGMAYLAEEYHASGWNVLSVDLRAHGESEGSIITMGVREGMDLSSWVDELVSRFACEDVFLHGVSMGANAALFCGAAARGVSRMIRGLIVDSFYPSFRDTLNRLLFRIVGNRFVARSITMGSSASARLFSGMALGRMDAGKALRRRGLPVLAFHGGSDAIIPLSSITVLFGPEVIPEAELVVIPEAPHIGAYFYGRDRYLSKIDTFTRRFS